MARNTTQLYSFSRILESPENRMSKARKIAEAIRFARDYRWVGIYDVDRNEIAAIAWSGAGCPTFPRFPADQGLNGAAVAARVTVIVNDVTDDPRYLTTFGSTQAEIVVPVLDPDSGVVAGTIDVESADKDAFTTDDRLFLEECAAAIFDLWR